MSVNTQSVNVVTHGQRVRILREAVGMSRPKFAASVGMCPTTLKNYELNYRELSIPSALLVATRFTNNASVLLYIVGMNDDLLKTMSSDQLTKSFMPLKV